MGAAAGAAAFALPTAYAKPLPSPTGQSPTSQVGGGRKERTESFNRADSFIDWQGAVDTDYVEALRALRLAYKLPLDMMRSLATHFKSEAVAGLAGQPSSVRMLPTFVNKRVTGAETGDFYALDLGGTNFRVLRLTLEGGGVVGPVKSMKFAIPDTAKTGTGADLFGFIADGVSRFIALECGGDARGALGFTFSFPVEQSALDAGKLIMWNKGFSASGVIGEDVVQLLQAQLASRGIALQVTALANDTVGTMETAAYKDGAAKVGLILGTGTNAAYLEKTSRVPKWQGAPCEEMVINTEWGNLQMDGYRNVFDVIIDEATSNPGVQTFEKMISGLYLGEICRTSILHPSVARGFSPAAAAQLRATFASPSSFQSSLMAAIEEDTSPTLAEVDRLLHAAGVTLCTVRDRVLLHEACACVSTRAARLSATATAALLEQAQLDQGACTVAVDGTVFECYPHFKQRMEAALDELLPAACTGHPNAPGVKLVLAKDGSGIGAAIIAALA